MSEANKERWETKGRDGHVRKFWENFHREDNMGAKGMDLTGLVSHGT